MRIIFIALLLSTGLVSAQDSSDTATRSYELYVNPNVISAFPDKYGQDIVSLEGTETDIASNAYLKPLFVKSFGMATYLKPVKNMRGRVGLQYAQTGKRFENIPGEVGSGIRFSSVDFTYSNIDLTYDIIYSLESFKTVDLYLSAGFGMRAWYVSKTKVAVSQVTDLDVTNEFEVAIDAPENFLIDASPFTLGFGINYKLSPRYSLTIEPNYILSPRFMGNKAYYSAFGLRLGLEFRSKKKYTNLWQKLLGPVDEFEPEVQ